MLFVLLLAVCVHSKALTDLFRDIEANIEFKIKDIEQDDRNEVEFRVRSKTNILKLRHSVTNLTSKNKALEDRVSSLQESSSKMQGELDDLRQATQTTVTIVSAEMSSYYVQDEYWAKYATDGDDRTFAATDWEFVPWYKAEVGVQFRRLTLYIDGFSYSTDDIFTIYAINQGVVTKCAEYELQYREFYKQTVTCSEPGDGFMISLYERSGLRTILELYEVKVGVLTWDK